MNRIVKVFKVLGVVCLVMGLAWVSSVVLADMPCGDVQCPINTACDFDDQDCPPCEDIGPPHNCSGWKMRWNPNTTVFRHCFTQAQTGEHCEEDGEDICSRIWHCAQDEIHWFEACWSGGCGGYVPFCCTSCKTIGTAYTSMQDNYKCVNN